MLYYRDPDSYGDLQDKEQVTSLPNSAVSHLAEVARLALSGTFQQIFI